MCSLSNIIKSFLIKLYVFVIMFALVFSVSFLINLINNRPTLIDKGSYISVGELAVSSNSINSNDNLDTYMNNVVERSKSNEFIGKIETQLKSEMEVLNILAELNLSEENKNEIKALTKGDIKSNLLIEIKEKTTIFIISYSNKTAAVAQAVNRVIIKTVYDTLDNDTDNILSGSIDKDGVKLSFHIDSDASLPTALTSSSKINTNSSINFLKITIISFAIYFIYVLIIDFAIGFISSKQQARTLVKVDIISEIEMPYLKNRKKKEEM